MYGTWQVSDSISITCALSRWSNARPIFARRSPCERSLVSWPLSVSTLHVFPDSASFDRHFTPRLVIGAFDRHGWLFGRHLRGTPARRITAISHFPFPTPSGAPSHEPTRPGRPGHMGDLLVVVVSGRKRESATTFYPHTRKVVRLAPSVH